MRHGHIPFERLKIIYPHLPISYVQDSLVCTICPLTCQRRLSFKNSEIKSGHAFELLHIDLWGPYVHPTYNGCTMFLTIVDDYTRTTWLYLLKSKNQWVTALRHFLSDVENKFDTNVKKIRSDNAKEFFEGDMLKLFLDKGILHQKICPETPQQNGVVESKHRHLIETARALSFQSNLLISF